MAYIFQKILKQSFELSDGGSAFIYFGFVIAKTPETTLLYKRPGIPKKIVFIN